jgi:sulfur relay (sulfurtransferase) complex TusBCD TusD component (DsrE family)
MVGIHDWRQGMGKYLLIESRDPFDSADVRTTYDLVHGLADDANDVTVFLVQNGVLPARKASSAADQIGQLASKATVLADDFSLRERGIAQDELVDGVTPSEIGAVVDLSLDEGRKVIWH